MELSDMAIESDPLQDLASVSTRVTTAAALSLGDSGLEATASVPKELSNKHKVHVVQFYPDCTFQLV